MLLAGGESLPNGGMVNRCVFSSALTHRTQAPGPMSFISSGDNGFFPESSIEAVMGFIHLHVHSQYSFLDGASSLDELLDKAVSLRMPALALTDHNRLTGAIRFYSKAKTVGIKPIIGA